MSIPCSSHYSHSRWRRLWGKTIARIMTDTLQRDFEVLIRYILWNSRQCRCECWPGGTRGLPVARVGSTEKDILYESKTLAVE